MPCRTCSVRPRPHQAPKNDRSSVRKPQKSYEFCTAETAERGVRGIGSKRDLAVLAYWISGILENLAGHVVFARAGRTNCCESAPEWPTAGKIGPRRGTAMP